MLEIRLYRLSCACKVGHWERKGTRVPLGYRLMMIRIRKR